MNANLTKPLLLILAVAIGIFACTPRAVAIFPFMLGEHGQVWIWTEEEMSELNDNIGKLRRERDAYKRIAETPRVCI